MANDINGLCAQFKEALQNGIGTNGVVVDAGTTPEYGGTGATEDFQDFTVYVVQINDTLNFSSIIIPCLVVDATVYQSSEEVYEDEVDGITFNVTCFVNDSNGIIMVDGEEYKNMKAVNIIVERLKEFLKKVELSDIFIVYRNVTTPIEAGAFEEDNGLLFGGSATLSIEYLKEL